MKKIGVGGLDIDRKDMVEEYIENGEIERDNDWGIVNKEKIVKKENKSGCLGVDKGKTVGKEMDIGGIEAEKGGLTDRQRRFCEEYLKDLNVMQAYIRAGFTTNGKKNCNAAYRWLKKAQVREYISKRQRELSEITQIQQADIIKELGTIAFLDVTDFVSITEKATPNSGEKREQTTHTVVSVKNTDEIPKEKRNAISFIKQGSYGVEIKFYDKMRALELLGKHLGLFDPAHTVSAETSDTCAGLISAIKEASGEVWEDGI